MAVRHLKRYASWVQTVRESKSVCKKHTVDWLRLIYSNDSCVKQLLDLSQSESRDKLFSKKIMLESFRRRHSKNSSAIIF